MESTTNANQKEKFEGDLKKEIKKLQVNMHSCCVVLLRYPKPTSKPRSFCKNRPRQNLGFSAISEGFWAHLHAKEFGEFHPANVSINTSTQFSLSHGYSTYTVVQRYV